MHRTRALAGSLVLLVVAAGLVLLLLRQDERGATSDVARGPGAPAVTTERSELPQPVVSPPTGIAAGPDAPVSPRRAADEATDSSSIVVSGRVVRPDGTSVGDATVLLVDSLGEDTYDGLVEARSLADGSFTLHTEGQNARRLIGRDDWLQVTHGDFDAAACLLKAVTAGERDAGVLVLPEGAGLRGRVVGTDGVPVSGVIVRVSTVSTGEDGRARFDADLVSRGPDVSRTLIRQRELRTDERGTFAFSGLPEGPARLELQPEQAKRLAFGDLALQPDRDLDLGDIALDEGLVIEGVVVGEDGPPVPPVNVRAERERPPLPERQGSSERSGLSSSDGVTDEAGHFRLAGLSAGDYQLVVSVPGHGWTVRSVPAGQRDVRLELNAGATLLLEVRDARTGKPVPDATLAARVELKLADGSMFSGGGGLLITHGAEAHLPADTFSIRGLGVGEAVLNVEAPGYSPARADVPSLASGASVTQRVLLDRALHLRGRVVDDQAQPIEQAVVQVAAQAGPAQGLATKLLRTGATGDFAFDGLARGNWQLWATADNCAGEASTILQFEAEDREGIVLRLVPAATLAGTALDKRGLVVPGTHVHTWLARPAALQEKPVPDASLVVTAAGRDPRASVEVEGDGRYEIHRLAPGEYLACCALSSDEDASSRLRQLAEAPGSTELPSGVVRVVLGAGETGRADFVLPAPARVRGAVFAGDHPVPGARVALLASAGESWRLVKAVTADEGGAFAFTELSAFDGVVVAGAETEIQPCLQGVRLREGDDLSVRLAFAGPGEAGRVVDVASQVAGGTPRTVPGVAVYARLAQPATDGADTIAILGNAAGNLLGAAKLPFAKVMSDADGRFALTHLAAGRWVVSANGGAWLSAGQASFEVKADWTPEDIVVPVKLGAVVEGRVSWELGGPAEEELTVGLYIPEQNTVARWVYAKHGTYRLDGLTAGSYELRVQSLLPGSAGFLHAEPLTLQAGEHRSIDLVVKG